ncbi:MAG: ATP-binding protein [Wenzhouxiangella sp.]
MAFADAEQGFVFERQVGLVDPVPSQPRRLLNTLMSQSEALFVAITDRPWWRNGWAFGILFLLIFALAAIIQGLNLHRRKSLEAEVRLRTAELVEQQAIVRRQAIELKDALESRTLFYANVAHEFRTPLTLIEASLSRLEDEGGDAESIEHSRRYLRRLLRLVDQLLDLSQLNGSVDFDQGAVWALAPVVNSTVDGFQALAEQNKVMLEADIEPGWFTRCSQENVESVLLNLITNALKFSPPDSEVSVSMVGNEDEVILDVADNGPGISVDDQALIFHRFFRAQDSTAAGISGAGIGLALVHEAVVAMGGRIDIDSEPGRGSRFRVCLPAWQGGPEAEPVEKRSATADLARIDELSADYEIAAASSENGQRGCVLVVENHADMRQHLREVLAGEWRVLEAEDGKVALDVARAYVPDVIVSDIMMPEMDGFELLAALRQDVETSHIPVLLLTARQDRGTRLKSLSLSADDFLSKPFDSRELRLRLRRMMDNRLRLRERLSAASRMQESVKQGSGPDLSERDRKLLGAVNESLNEHASDPEFTVEALAESVLLERRTLQRKLKTLTGLTPANYIRQHRFYQARQMMLETDLSVNEIAFSCGFGSAQHFSRAFRRHYGMPPDKWRQNQKASLNH